MVLSPRRIRILAAAGACFWIIGIVLWRQAALDMAIQLAHNTLRAVTLIAEIAKGLSTFGLTLSALLFLICLARSCRPCGSRDFRRIMLPVLLSFAIAGPVADLSKEVFSRPRPFVENPEGIVPITRPPAYSLPSGHTTKIFALILPFVVLLPPGKGRKAFKIALVVLAGAVAWSRIILGVHFLGDILAGIGTAFLVLPLAAAAANAVYSARGMTEKKELVLAAACGLALLALIVTFFRYSL